MSVIEGKKKHQCLLKWQIRSVRLDCLIIFFNMKLNNNLFKPLQLYSLVLIGKHLFRL